MERKIASLNWADFAEKIQNIRGVILPIGTIEAHGCTNLGTDATIPEYLANRIAERLDLLVAPTISYGVTRTLLPYPGSLTVSSDTFFRYIFEISESLVRAGFEWVLFLNGHGGHIEELARASRELWANTGGKSIVVHWWDFCAKITKEILGEPGAHAGIDETYMVMAAAPELVEKSRFDPKLAFDVREGAFPYPNPGSILLYEKKRGLPRFDPNEAARYADAVVDEIVNYIEIVLAGWDRDLPLDNKKI